MGTYHGPKVRLTRRVGSPIAETPKHTNVRRTTRPGIHGRHRPRRSLYGERLAEKQKLAAYYNLRDRQFTRHVEQAQAVPGSTTDALQQILESRLDNVIRRLGWARTIWQARQMVSHGHFYINGHKVDIPSYEVRPGEEITVKPGSEVFVRAAVESAAESALHVPGWLSADNEALRAKVLRLPAPEEIRLPFEIDVAKIIEMYKR
jgi:small subunit ribosomal protein S4